MTDNEMTHQMFLQMKWKIEYIHLCEWLKCTKTEHFSSEKALLFCVKKRKQLKYIRCIDENNEK